MSATPAPAHWTQPGTTGGRAAGWLAGNVILVLACAYFLVPLLWMITSAAKAPGVLFTSPGFGWSGHFDLISNIERTLSYQGGIYRQWLLNSLLYSVGAAGVGCMIATMAGFALAKYEFTGKKIVFGLVLSGVLLPATSLVIPLYLEFSHLHLVNTYLAVFLPSIFSPFGVYICRIYAAAAIPPTSSTQHASTAPGNCGYSGGWPCPSCAPRS